MSPSPPPYFGVFRHKAKIVRLALLAGIAAAAGFAFLHLDLQEALQGALSWIAGSGPAGVFFFIGLYIVASVLMLPGSILTLGAGAVFGLSQGIVAVLAGATLGASCAFLAGRYLAREWVARKIAGNPRFRAVDEAVGREGWKIVLLTRLSPIFPFNILNYSYGLTKISLRHYFLASMTGMLPGTLLYTYLGSLVGDLAALGAGRAQRTPAEWALYAAGLAATAAVTVFVTRVARRALAQRIEP